MAAVVAGTLVCAAAVGTCAVVEPGDRGVYVLFGETREEALEPGLHWKNPMASVERINARQVVFDQECEASSSDLQTIHTRVAVNYRPQPDEVWRLYKDIGPTNEDWEGVLLRPAIQEISKAVTAKFTAEELIKKRAEAKEAITEQIVARLEREHLVVTEVSITDFGFNKAFNEAIEAKQIAEQKAKQAQNELRKAEIDAQQRIVSADASKKATILGAEAQAESIRIVATAEADYQRRIAESATDEGLRLRTIEKWNGVMPSVVGDGQFMVDIGVETAKPAR